MGSRTEIELIKENNNLRKELQEVKQSHASDNSKGDDVANSLNETKDTLQSILENSSDQLMLVDLDLNIRFINRTVPELNKTDVVGQSIFAFVPPQQKKLVKEKFQHVIQSGEPDRYQAEYQPKNGEPQYFDVRLSPIKENDRVVSIVSSLTNITQTITTEKNYRKAGEALQNIQDQLITSIHSMPNAYILWDKNLHIIEWNKAAESIFGYSKEEMLGKDAVKYIVPEQVQGLVETVLKKLKSGEVAHYSEKDNNIRKDGKLISCQWSNSTLTDKNGNVTGILTLAQDITERLAAEEAGRVSEERWQFAIDGSNLGLWDWNILTGEAFFSPRWKKMLGFDEDELLGNLDQWNNLIHSDDKEQVHIAINKHLDKKTKYYRNEHRVLCKDKTYKWILDRGKVISFTDDGKPLRMIGTHSDITERKKIVEKLHTTQMHYTDFINSSSDSVGYWKMPESLKTDQPIEDQVAMLYQLVCVDANKTCWERMGLKSKNEAIGRKYIDLISEKTADESFAKFINNDYRLNNHEFHQSFPDGNEHYSLENWHGVIENGALTHLWASSTDITERKQAEDALMESEEKFRTLYNHAPDMYASVSADDASVLECNETLLIQTGYSKEEIVGSPVFKLYHKDCIKKANETFNEFSKFGKVNNKELKLRRKDGTTIDVMLNVEAIRDSEGRIARSVSSWRDITEFNKTHKMAQLFSSIFDKTLNEVYLFQPDLLKFISVNKAAQDNLGYTMEELRNLTPLDLKPEFTIATFAKLVEPLRTGAEQIIVFETMHKRKDKTMYPVEVHLQLIDYGREALFTAIILDITERKNIEATLQESELRFRTIYENSPVLIDAFDKNGRCVLWNKQCKETFGWTIDEINAHDNPLALFYPDPDVQDEVMKTVTTDPDGSFREWYPVTKEGKTLTTMWANFSLPDGLTYNIGYDITASKLAEEKLKSRNRELQTFNDVVVGREIKMIELKKEINELLEKSGKKSKYLIPG